MGNQSTKLSVKSSKLIADDVDIKKSRTSWTAGVPSSPGRPVIELSSRITAPEEDSVTDEINLTWAVPDDDGGYPITGYRVEMLDIQSGKWIEITFIEGYEPKCTLSNILYGIMYRFRVIALNDAGPSDAGEPSEPIVIDVPGVQIAPYFVQMLNDTIALEHEKVEFRVRVLGTPKPSVQWYKDDMEIFACERIEIAEEDEGGAVILKGARLNDSGTIKCVASNILGRCTSTATFNIEAAPRFELPENYTDGLIFRHEEVVRLKVPMVAKPLPKVVWFFEDEPISAGSDLTIETTDSYTSLRIQGAKRWHCGEFRVYAENEYGEDACSILVTVTSPPSPPGRPVVIDISETKCTLRWEPSEDDGGADVKHYIVEYFRDVWEVWLKAKTTKETQVTIDDLIPGSRYKFRIKAENSYGITEPGDESDPFDVGGVSSDRSGDDSWTSPTPPEITIEVTTEPPTLIKRSNNMAKAKELWGSDEQDEDILDRFLKVKKFQENQLPSYESDGGMPSMIGIEEQEELDVAETTGRNARRLFAELQQFSNDTNHPDLESISEDEDLNVNHSKEDLRRARQLYEELRHMSTETGGSIENLIEGISTSNESMSSIIPLEKRQELSKFEMTLKEMIEEAKQLAMTPFSSHEDLYSRKSPSILSMAESVVSVIERRRSEDRMQPAVPKISVTSDGREGRAPSRSPPIRPERKSPSPQMMMRRLSDNASMPDINQQFRPSPGSSPNSTLQRRKELAAQQAKNNNEPLVGADRYEEIIEARHGRRGSSVLSGPRSHQGSMTNLYQPGTTMAMREETKAQSLSRASLMMDLPNSRQASTNFLNNMGGSSNKINQIIPDRPGSAMMMNSNQINPERPGLAMMNNIQAIPDRPGSAMINHIQVNVPSPQPLVIKRQLTASMEDKRFVASPIEPTINPVRPVDLEHDDYLYNPGPNMVRTSYPDWLMITVAYSAVFIGILLLSNITPNGKLYIHFTAFFSMVLYFLMDDTDTTSTDVLETVMEGFVKTGSKK